MKCYRAAAERFMDLIGRSSDDWDEASERLDLFADDFAKHANKASPAA